MATPFTFSTTLTYPPDEGQANAERVGSVAANFDSKSEKTLQLTGSGTIAVDLGTIISPGTKAIFIEVDPGTGIAPINVQFNGGGAPGQVEISPGGFLCLASPVPIAGVTAIDIVHTTQVTVRFRALG
jgi:hypothetical protein